MSEQNFSSGPPRLTIVGGQPRQKHQKEKIDVSIGIEKVLYLAASNADFKTALLKDRRAALAAFGLRLRRPELALLFEVPQKTLELMISRLVPENPWRRRFMGVVASTVVSLAAGTAAIGCREVNEAPPPRDTVPVHETDTVTDTGTSADTNWDTIQVQESDMVTDTGTSAGTDWDTITVQETETVTDTGTSAGTDWDTITVQETETVTDTGTSAGTDLDTITVQETETATDTGTSMDTDWDTF